MSVASPIRGRPKLIKAAAPSLAERRGVPRLLIEVQAPENRRAMLRRRDLAALVRSRRDVDFPWRGPLGEPSRTRGRVAVLFVDSGSEAAEAIQKLRHEVFLIAVGHLLAHVRRPRS